MNTKEKILLTSLELFSKKGFESSSVGDISDALGLSKGALYKHYDGKQGILDSIIDRMDDEGADFAKTHGLPAETCFIPRELYSASIAEMLRCFALNMFDYWTGEGFAPQFRRMLTVDRFASGKIAALYRSYLGEDVLNYVKQFFGPRFGGQAEEMSLELYGVLHLLISLSDTADEDELRDRLGEYTDSFIEKYDI